MNIINLTLFIFVNFSLSYCSLELTLGTFLTSAISSNDFVKNVNTAFYWTKNIYRLIKDIKSVGSESKPNLNKITKELSLLDKNMQTSLKGIKQILMDQHFQTHIELPTFALYRHVTTYISNPTTISENELIEACSKRYSPNDILSSLSLLLQKQWFLNKLKETDYDKDTVDGSELFIENLIKQLIVAQSFCIELRYSNTGDQKSYRVLTVKFVEEIRSLIMKQVKTLKKSLNNQPQLPKPCTSKAKKKKSDDPSSSMMVIKSPYYLVKYIWNLLYALFNDLFYLIYYILYHIFNGIKLLLFGIYNILVYILLSLQYLFIALKNFIVSLFSYIINFVSISFLYLLNFISFISYHTFDLLLWSFKPLIVSVIVTAAYDEYCGEQRLRNMLDL